MNRLIGYQQDLLGGPEMPVWSSGKPPAAKTPREQGEQAAKACAAKAEAVAAWDRAGAREAALAMLKAGDMTGEDISDKLTAQGFRVHDQRAYGALIGGLSRQGLIRCVGIIERRKGNGTAGARLWRLA